MKTSSTDSLTLKTKIGFGICDVGGNLFFTVIAFHLAVYLTDTVGLAAGLMGVALLIGRIVDAVTDPLMGYISDRTKSRWGRRRPYLFFGSILLFIFMALMFSTPALDSQLKLFIWVAVSFSLLSTSYTVVNIPYGALTPELTQDFHERTVLNGYRMSFAVVGTLIGAGAAFPIITLFATQQAGYSVMGIIFGAVMLVTAWITVFTVKEPVHNEGDSTVASGKNPLQEYRAAFKNKPFLLILFPWAFFIAGVTILSSMLKYLFDYVIGDPEGVTFALLIMLVCALAAIPGWVKISKRIGKKRCYMIGMSLLGAFALVIAFFSDSFSTTGLYLILVPTGIGLSTHYIIPYALIPDAAEWDFHKTGIRREGIYYGLWTFISKLGQGLSGLIIGLVLSSTGYVANIAQESRAILGIRMLMGPIPAVIFLAGIIILSFYPITEKVYNKMLEEES